MKVWMLTAISGRDINYAAGDLAEVDAETGQRLIEVGLAQPVAENAPPDAPRRGKRTARSAELPDRGEQR
ncbi:DUF7302 family protein [Crossiella sp. CA198]|uniref:DUF7302 family protein n=1 Tax=Crossiella sp. CA198 TaxID=3455607 RepID=UPI003F8D70F1